MKTAARFLLVLFTVLATGPAGAAWARNAPDFSLPGVNGKTITLSSYRGKYVVVDFIQTACPHCQVAAKVLEKFYKEHPNRLAVISISHDAGGMDAIRQYTKEHGLTYPVVLGDRKVAQDYLGVSPQRPSFQVPVFFFIGPSGQILEERSAERISDQAWYADPEKSLEASIKKMLPAGKPAAGKPPAPVKKRPAAKKQP